MIGEELARCHVGAMLRDQPGRYYCARCLAALLDGAVSTKREARRAIAVLFRRPIGLTATLRGGRQPCRRCGDPIRRRIQGPDARVTFWCHLCQPMPDGSDIDG